jgi:capsular polysaccharide biosynthesis protein
VTGQSDKERTSRLAAGLRTCHEGANHLLSLASMGESPATPAEGESLSHVLRRAWSFRYVAVLGLVVGALIAVLVSQLLPQRYIAATQVLVRSSSEDVANPDGGRRFNGVNVDTLASMAVSKSAVQAAAAAGEVPVDQLTPRVTVVPDTSVLVLYVIADTGKAAQAASSELARQLLERRSAELSIPTEAVGSIVRVGTPSMRSPQVSLWAINGAALGLLLGCLLRLGYSRLHPSGARR